MTLCRARVVQLRPQTSDLDLTTSHFPTLVSDACRMLSLTWAYRNLRRNQWMSRQLYSHHQTSTETKALIKGGFPVLINGPNNGICTPAPCRQGSHSPLTQHHASAPQRPLEHLMGTVRTGQGPVTDRDHQTRMQQWKLTLGSGMT